MVYSYKNSFIEIIPKYLLQVATHCETKDGGRAQVICGHTPTDSANGSYEEIRVSFRGNTPRGGSYPGRFCIGTTARGFTHKTANSKEELSK